MQAYKLKGIVDEAGNLAIASPVKMLPGEVEIIILQVVETVDNEAVAETTRTINLTAVVNHSYPAL